MNHEKSLEKEQRLLQNIKHNLSVLEELLKEVSDHWVEEDQVYRFYHQSFKAYDIQHYTAKIAEELATISPHNCLNQNPSNDTKDSKNNKPSGNDNNNPLDENKNFNNNKYKKHFCEFFLDILQKGTGKIFEYSHNVRWSEEVIPLFTAFFHTKYFLEMSVKYGKELDSPPQPFPSGWAALLELYGIR